MSGQLELFSTDTPAAQPPAGPDFTDTSPEKARRIADSARPAVGTLRSDSPSRARVDQGYETETEPPVDSHEADEATTATSGLSSVHALKANWESTPNPWAEAANAPDVYRS